jgi:hypothetical protein
MARVDPAFGAQRVMFVRSILTNNLLGTIARSDQPFGANFGRTNLVLAVKQRFTRLAG